MELTPRDVCAGTPTTPMSLPGQAPPGFPPPHPPGAHAPPMRFTRAPQGVAEHGVRIMYDQQGTVSGRARL